MKKLIIVILIFLSSSALSCPDVYLFQTNFHEVWFVSIPIHSMDTWRCVYCGAKNPESCSVCHNCGKSK